MNYKEAIEWLKGNRSTNNLFDWNDKQSHVMCAQADAALTQQAYCVVKAYKENLLEEDTLR